MTKEIRTERKERAIRNSISYWNEKKQGIYRWHEKQRYTIEYCETQIHYFKNLKL